MISLSYWDVWDSERISRQDASGIWTACRGLFGSAPAPIDAPFNSFPIWRGRVMQLQAEGFYMRVETPSGNNVKRFAIVADEWSYLDFGGFVVREPYCVICCKTVVLAMMHCNDGWNTRWAISVDFEKKPVFLFVLLSTYVEPLNGCQPVSAIYLMAVGSVATMHAAQKSV